jgi:DNA-binding MarR family transcriptional regulator
MFGVVAVGLYEDLERELGLLVLSADRAQTRFRHSDVHPLERMAYYALGRLIDLGPMRPSALADVLRLDLSTVSRHLTALEHLGYLRRERDPADGRAQLVQVTDMGAAVLQDARAGRCHRMRGLVGDWDEADRQDLVRLLRRLNVEVNRREHEWNGGSR